MPKELPRFVPCKMCGTTQANRSGFCTLCEDELGREFPTANEPTCADCGSVLHRGHCYTCLDRAVVFS